MIANLGPAFSARNARTVAYNSGVNPAVRFVIFMGGFLTIGFTLLFGFKKKWLQYVMQEAPRHMPRGLLRNWWSCRGTAPRVRKA